MSGLLHKFILGSAALSADAIEPRVSPDIKNMSFVLMTPKENFSFPLMEAKSMWGHPAFDPTKKVVILTTGWTTDLKEPRNDINTLAEAYFCRGDSNFVVRCKGNLFSFPSNSETFRSAHPPPSPRHLELAISFHLNINVITGC